MDDDEFHFAIAVMTLAVFGIILGMVVAVVLYGVLV